MGTTTNRAYPYPASTDDVRPHEDIQALAEAVDTDVQTIVADWSSYTPVWSSSGTAPALGNGTLTGKYKRVGDTVHIRIVLLLGTTSTVGSGTYRFSLPVAGKNNSLMPMVFKDGSARYSGTCEIVAETTTGDNMRLHVDGGTGTVGAAAPVVPGNGDQIIIAGSYEAA
jgi:hypothetical protein